MDSVAHRAGHVDPAHRARHGGSSWNVSDHITVLGPRREDRRGPRRRPCARTRGSLRPTSGQARATASGATPILQVEDIHVVLRRDRGAQGHLAGGGRGRDRHADRRQRRRQDDDAARSISGIVPPRAGRDLLPDGKRHHRDARAPGRLDRHRPVARGPADLPAHDGASRTCEMGAFTRKDNAAIARRRRARLRDVPAPARSAMQQTGGHAVRRRAADARHRPRADGPAPAAAPRRALARSRAR